MKELINITLNKKKALRSVLLIMTLFLYVSQLTAAKNVFDSTRTTRPKIGLVLSGGGAKGFAHIGALKVLQEAGIEFDYISGTSMGSIVGGLYAMGYSPQYIDTLVRQANWSVLLLDKIDRRQLTLDEKSYNDRQSLSFPVTKEKVSLPFGIKEGQNVSLLLSRLTSPVYQYKNFSDFQTPFLCIATDISNGKSVVLDKGNLADAMRASMAIPTIFSPVTIDGKLLVDGGLVNNFPAKELAERGCDIIIGIDVQDKTDYKIEDLNSITSIIDRSASFYREALNDTAAKYVDYYIHPDITGYGVGSFSDADSIVLRGEKAAEEHLPELEKLVSYLKSFPDYHQKIRDLQPLSTFVLDSIIIQGNKEVSSKIIKSVFNFQKGDVVDMEDVNKRVEQLYGSLFFDKVKYSLLPGNNGAILKISVEEAAFGNIGIGLHYDSDYNAGILITSQFRNVLVKNTLLEAAFGLSINPYAYIKYYQNRGLLPSFALKANWLSFSFIDYVNGKDKVGEYRLSDLSLDIYMQSVMNKTLSVGGGAQLQFSSLRNNIGFVLDVSNSTFQQSYFNFFAFAKIDRMDHSFFPHRGGKADIQATFVTTLFTGGNANLGYKSTVLYGEYDKAIPLSPRFTLRPRINAGYTLGSGTYISRIFFLGGLGAHYLPGMVTFSGLNMAQLKGTYLYAGRIRLQYKFLKKNYIMATLDAGNARSSLSEMSDLQSAAMGYAIGWGYDSFFGPIEFSVMGSNYRGLSAFINIGFWL